MEHPADWLMVKSNVSNCMGNGIDVLLKGDYFQDNSRSRRKGPLPEL